MNIFDAFYFKLSTRSNNLLIAVFFQKKIHMIFVLLFRDIIHKKMYLNSSTWPVPEEKMFGRKVYRIAYIIKLTNLHVDKHVVRLVRGISIQMVPIERNLKNR